MNAAILIRRLTERAQSAYELLVLRYFFGLFLNILVLTVCGLNYFLLNYVQ